MTFPSILYIGPLSEGGTCRERKRVLEDYGYKVIDLDTVPFLEQGARLLRSFENRFLFGPNVLELNNEILKLSSDLKRIDIIWVDKGRWLFPDVLEKVKRDTGAICIHYTPDPAFTVHTSRHFFKSIKIFDLCVTTKDYEINKYLDYGAKNILFTLQGVDDRFNDYTKSKSNLIRNGSIFVGHCEAHYINVLKEVVTVDSSLQIYGSGWTKGASFNPKLLKSVKGEGAWGLEYPRVLASAKIGLGLLCKNYPDNFTTRSFEVPASGAMLLAERTNAHLSLFTEGVEAEYFSSLSEMKEKLMFYLNNESALLGVAAAGQKRCLNEYHWKKVLMPVIEWIENNI